MREVPGAYEAWVGTSQSGISAATTFFPDGTRIIGWLLKRCPLLTEESGPGSASPWKACLLPQPHWCGCAAAHWSTMKAG